MKLNLRRRSQFFPGLVKLRELFAAANPELNIFFLNNDFPLVWVVFWNPPALYWKGLDNLLSPWLICKQEPVKWEMIADSVNDNLVVVVGSTEENKALKDAASYCRRYGAMAPQAPVIYQLAEARRYQWKLNNAALSPTKTDNGVQRACAHFGSARWTGVQPAVPDAWQRTMGKVSISSNAWMPQRDTGKAESEFDLRKIKTHYERSLW